MNRTRKCLLLFLFLTAFVGQANATDYFVRTSGNDDNDGISASTAFATINQAAMEATSGDTVYVGGGTYTDAVYVLGVKASNSALRFVGDTNGSATGDSGPVVISGVPIRVAGSNFVELQNFTFQGGAAYPLIWENSYEGVVTDCNFVGGQMAVLLKDGSLKLDTCQLADFQQDAIQVDGEARLTVEDCTISDSLRHGILVRKDAITLVDDSTISGSAGDGIQVNVVSDSLSLSTIPAPDCDCVGTSPVAQRQQARDLLASVTLADPVYQAILTSAYNKLNASLDSSLWTDEWHIDISSASTVFDNMNDAIEEINAVLTEDVDFIIQNGEIVVSHPFVAEIDVVGAAITSGGYNMPVTVRMNVGSSHYEPWGSFSSPTQGDVNDNNNPRNFQSPDTFDATDSISVDARSWSKVNGSYSGDQDSHWNEYLTVNSGSGSGNVIVLRDGDAVPPISGYNGQSSAETFLQPYIDSNDVITLQENQAIFLFELGTTNLGSSAADFQDLVVVVTMARSITPLTQAEKDALTDILNLLMESTRNLVECAIDEGTVAGGNASDLQDADNSHQTAIAAANNADYVNAGTEWETAWLAAKAATGNVDPDLNTVVSQLIQASPPTGWTSIASGAITVDDSNLSNNENGVVLESNTSFSANNSTFESNQYWGLSLRGSTALDGCIINDNLYGGVRLTSMTDSDLSIQGLDLTNNTEYGVFFSDCTLTVDQDDVNDWDISGSNYVFAGQLGGLTVSGATISGGSVAGVYLHQGTLTVQNSTFSSNGYGIAADESVVTITNSTVTQNSTGIYTNNNSTVDISGTNIHNNSVTGAAFNSPAAKVTLTNSHIYDNVNGVSLTGAIDGDFELVTTIVRDNSQHGLHFDNCALTLADQSTNNWQTLRNGCGVTCENSSLTFNDVQIDDSVSYGVYGIGSTIIMNGCTVTAANGAYVAADNVSFSASATQFNATGITGAWGLSQLGGTMSVRNCLVKGFDNGLYLNGGTSEVMNATLVSNSAYGVYVSGADATVQNTILSGFNGQQALTLVGGQLSHSYNLIHGFSTAFTGTTAHSTELLKKPHFVDAFSNDYHLAVGSPAINSGADLSAQFSGDLDGNTRPSHGAFEIGAYEYTNSQGSYRVLDWQEAQ